MNSTVRIAVFDVQRNPCLCVSASGERVVHNIMLCDECFGAELSFFIAVHSAVHRSFTG